MPVSLMRGDLLLFRRYRRRCALRNLFVALEPIVQLRRLGGALEASQDVGVFGEHVLQQVRVFVIWSVEDGERAPIQRLSLGAFLSRH